MDALRVLAFLTLIGVSSSQNQTKDCSYLNLLTHLQLTPANDALRIMRPVKNWEKPTTVGLDMVIFGILHVDEKYQTVESHIWIQMNWVNEYLSWNPSDFCGIDMLTVPRSRLWLPDIYIQEDASDTGSIQNSELLKLLNSGVVIASSRQRLTSTCLLDLKLFPFDSQKCEITFASMNCFEKEILLGTENNGSSLYRISDQLMVTRGEWELDNMIIRSESIKKDVVQSRLVYTVLISRKPMLYVINFIVPLFYLLVLDLASFFINQSGGEKLSFKVTILLAISVLLLILQDMLPSTESNMPYIASYCVAVFALVGISVMEAMLVGFLYDLDSYCASKRGCCADTKVEVELEDGCQNEPSGGEEDIQMKEEKSFLPLDGPNGLNMLKGILEEVKAARQQASRQEEDEEKKPGGYKKIAEILDHLFFVFYLLTVVVFLAYMYIVWFSKILS
ncbi:5-hydroxytryptamine receptor 3A-like [Labrus mixtus]|uniref:5-hydroxytryptamine receptor 3A-like n=1 Tax=Labrus mixtus TaxID=508554 RepID=UPI0029C0F1E9|nr:5-hydroxytryptamine receptor 3A-like [Labrus mixtus]XP_060882659.1 5-hydroxytryptamine receptor 3A-like [Labrus mixtus]